MTAPTPGIYEQLITEGLKTQLDEFAKQLPAEERPLRRRGCFGPSRVARKPAGRASTSRCRRRATGDDPASSGTRSNRSSRRLCSRRPPDDLGGSSLHPSRGLASQSGLFQLMSVTIPALAESETWSAAYAYLRRRRQRSIPVHLTTHQRRLPQHTRSTTRNVVSLTSSFASDRSPLRIR